MEKILQVKNLNISFHTHVGEVKAVRGIDFHLDKGETLAIVGESGCGKTVTAKAILRLLKEPPAEIKEGSEILFNNENILKMNSKRLASLRGSDISMIFQDPMTSLNPTMTVGNQIIEALKIHKKLSEKEAKQEAIRLLELVKIPNASERIGSYPHELSGGMRQRIMIAIALSCNPKILLADEPTTALDVTIQAQIMDLLNELKTELDTSIILVTHDLGVVANFADRIQVMYAGNIVETGSKQEVFYNPQHPYTWALLNSVPRLDNKAKDELYSLGGTPPDLLLPLIGCPFASRCDYAMEICTEVKPEYTILTGNHKVSCWLKHPLAPKVERHIVSGGEF